MIGPFKIMTDDDPKIFLMLYILNNFITKENWYITTENKTFSSENVC